MLFSSVKKAAFWGVVAGLMAAVFMAGIYLGYTNRPAVQKITDLFNKEAAIAPSQVDFSLFWKVWNAVETKYAGRSGIDRQKMVWARPKAW